MNLTYLVVLKSISLNIVAFNSSCKKDENNGHHLIVFKLYIIANYSEVNMIVAIDGPAGSGKSSTAKKVAMELGFVHLDTGAMYRAITLDALNKGVDYKDDKGLKELVEAAVIEFQGVLPNTKVLLNGVDVSTEIRSDEVTKNVSDYCAPLVVREALVEQQKKIGHATDTVCEGRDMGSVVFPDAELKFYMIASVEARAIRRQIDFKKMGVEKSVEELVADIEERDRKDSSRENSPLLMTDDSILLDTTDLTFDEQVDVIVQKVRSLQK